MKATDLLQTQHRDIERLFDQLESDEGADPRAAREELGKSLVAHTVIEREIFYPALRAAASEGIAKAAEEHTLVELELYRLLTGRLPDVTRRARIAVLRQLFEGHTREEEDQLFRQAQRVLSDEVLEELGARMEKRHTQALHQGVASYLRKALAENLPKARATAPAKSAPAKKTARRSQASQPRKTTQKAAVETPKRSTARRGAGRPQGAPRSSSQARKAKVTTSRRTRTRG